MTKTPKGELTGAELRKLIKAHNILVSIKIPKGTDRDGLIKLIENKGYKVDHKNKKIVDAKKDRPRRPRVTLKEAQEITKPKPKTALEKQKLAEAKAEKEEKKKKEERVIRKKAVEEEKKRAKPKPLPKKKPAKKEDEIRPKEKVGRQRVDPKKIKVIEPKKKPLTRQEYDKLARKAVKDITPTEKKLMKEYEDKNFREEEPLVEKVETRDEKFYRILKFVINRYNVLAGDLGYVDMPQRRKDALINGLGSLINKKKTSNFTKSETKFLQRAIKYLKSNRDEKDAKILESFLSSK